MNTDLLLKKCLVYIALMIFCVMGRQVTAAEKEDVIVIEAENLITDNVRTYYGNDRPGAYKMPYYYRNESGGWSVGMKEGGQDVLSTQINCASGKPYYLYLRLGVRNDNVSACKLKVGDYSFDFSEKGNSKSYHRYYRWVTPGKPLKLNGKIPLELSFKDQQAVVDCIVLRTENKTPPNDCSPLGYPFNHEFKGVFSAIYPAYNFKMPLYICAGTAQHFLLSHSNLTEKTFKKWTVKITVPDWLQLLDPSVSLRRKEGTPGTLGEKAHFSRPVVGPSRISTLKSHPGGLQEYTLTYENCDLPPKLNSLRTKRDYCYSLVFKALSGNHSEGTVKIQSTTPDGVENTVEQKVVCLPEPSVKAPASRLAALHGPYIEYLSTQEQEALVQSMHKFGANALLLSMPKIQEDYKRVETLAAICKRNGIGLGFSLHRAFPFCPYDPTMSDDYTAKYPQHKGVISKKYVTSKLVEPSFNAMKSSVVEPEHLASDRSEYILWHIRMVSDLMNRLKLKHIMVDFEESYPFKFSFSKRSIDVFRKEKNIPDDIVLTEDVILQKYRKEWLDFRCRQNSRIIKNITQLLKEVIPDVKVILYSGYQNEHYYEKIGIDWKYMIPEVDFALGGCGIGTPQHSLWIHDTVNAVIEAGLPTAKAAFTEHSIDDWSGDERFSPPHEYGARGVLAIGTGAIGGIYSWYWGCMDGVTLSGFSEISALLSKLEKDGWNNSRSEVLYLSNEAYVDGAILKAQGRDEALLFICNVFANQRTFDLAAVRKKLGDFSYTDYLNSSEDNPKQAPKSLTLDRGKYVVWRIVGSK